MGDASWPVHREIKLCIVAVFDKPIRIQNIPAKHIGIHLGGIRINSKHIESKLRKRTEELTGVVVTEWLHGMNPRLSVPGF